MLKYWCHPPMHEDATFRDIMLDDKIGSDKDITVLFYSKVGNDAASLNMLTPYCL